MPKRTEKIAITVEAPTTKKRKGVVPKSAFKEGNPYAFKKGQSGNPSGRPSAATDRLLSKAFRVQLGARAKDEVTSALDLPRGSSWATCLAASAIRRAVRGSVADLQAILSATEPASRNGQNPMGLDGESMGGVVPELHISLVQARPELLNSREPPTLDAATE
jgi:hypothetical protein